MTDEHSSVIRHHGPDGVVTDLPEAQILFHSHLHQLDLHILQQGSRYFSLVEMRSCQHFEQGSPADFLEESLQGTTVEVWRYSYLKPQQSFLSFQDADTYIKNGCQHPLAVGQWTSPWLVCEQIINLTLFAFDVKTIAHGGVMILQEQEEFVLSPMARAIGFQWEGYLCFEEDGASSVVYYEHPEWSSLPGSEAEKKAAFRALVALHHPTYFQ